MKQLFLALATVCCSVAASAQDYTSPIRYTWITTSCETWDCASSAFLQSAGDRNTIVMPTGNEKRPWLVLRRVQEGSTYIPETEPFACEVFDKMDGAMTRYSGLAPCHYPTILNVTDGRAVVMSMPTCEPEGRRRSAGH
jgi:hypothetical protein